MDRNTVRPWEVQNRSTLVDHGNVDARDNLLGIAADTLRAVHPRSLVPGVVSTRDDALSVDGRIYSLDEYNSISVLGMGKGSVDLVDAVCTHLETDPDRIVVVDKHNPRHRIDGAKVVTAGHPIPDASSLAAGRTVTEFANEAGEDELVIVCVTGGASSLVAAPTGEISLGALAELNHLLMHSGLPIESINAVRKPISRIKGGRLAAMLDPATVISMIIVDEVGGEPWGPTVHDPSDSDRARVILRNSGLWDRTPQSVRQALDHDAQSASTPNRPPVHQQIVVLADAVDLCHAARRETVARGLTPVVLGCEIEGESSSVGRVHAGIGREVGRRGDPVEPPCVLITGGETTVTLDTPSGGTYGGPNQEFALAVANDLPPDSPVTALAMDTDGTDGPTTVAGGLVDGSTARRVTASVQSDIHNLLERHASTRALRNCGDAILTGPTGTNVMDLRLIHIQEG